MRVTKRDQARRVAMAEAKVEIVQALCKFDLSNLESLLVLAEVSMTVSGRAVSREIREGES